MARTQEYSAKEVADALRNANGVVAQAASRLGCSARTVYRYVDRYATVREAMEESRKDIYAEAQGYLVAMMRDRKHKDHRWAVEQVLRHYGEHIADGLDFTEKQKLEHSGSIRHEHDIDWENLSDEQVEALAAGASPEEVIEE